MALLRCKMCGGDMTVDGSRQIGICDYCGCSMTIPQFDGLDRLKLFNMGNDYRLAGDFNKAIDVFDGITKSDTCNAEAYWGLVLSKYGIEYVEDPITFERVPTCHRVSINSILDDIDYKKAIEYSDGLARKMYVREAQKINEIQKGILEISQQEEPYDIFICYKETDSIGQRTEDSVIAQELYEGLIKKGYRVFYSKITLEDKLGEEYEPYIFAALNSAKVMLVIVSDIGYITSPWVKNEWGRYLEIIKNDTGRVLIPCYKNIVPKDLPVELNRLQGQNMEQIGFEQDLFRGIEKIIGTHNSIVQVSNTRNSKLERAFQYIEDGWYEKASDTLDDILEEDTRCAKAYIGLLLCDLEISTEEELVNLEECFANNRNFQRAMEVAQGEYKTKINNYNEIVKKRYMDELTEWGEDYDFIVEEFYHPNEDTNYGNMANDLEKILKLVGDWKDARKLAEECRKKEKDILEEKKRKYNRAKEYNASLKNRIVVRDSLIAALKENGTVAAISTKSTHISTQVKNWRGIAAIDANQEGTLVVALTVEGSFVSTSNFFNCEMSKYRYKKVIAGNDCVVGLKKDGTVFGIIGDSKFEPEDWKGIKDIFCDGQIVVSIDDKGVVQTNKPEIGEKRNRQLVGIEDVLCVGNTIYYLNKSGYAGCLQGGDYQQFVNIERIGSFDGKLYALDKNGSVISSDAVDSNPHKVKNFSDRSGGVDFSYSWSNNLIDFGVSGKTMYGLKDNGTVIRSNREIVRVSGYNYISTGEEEIEGLKNVVALYICGAVQVVLLADGTLKTNQDCFNISGWKLFDDVVLKGEHGLISCPGCGTKIPSNKRFCPHCGQRLSKAE